MAALQQSPIAFTVKTPPSTRISPRSVMLSSSRSSFSGQLKLPSLKLSVRRTKSRGGGASGAKMADSAAASYAAALADVAKSNKSLEATSADVEKVEKIFSDKSVFDFFTNPTISLEKKRELLDQILDSSKFQSHVANFLNILIDNKRMDLIKEIVKDFEIVYNKITDTELAIVTSVVKLESNHLAQIAQNVQRLTGAKNVRIKTVLDPSLVAGFTVRYGSSGSKLIDLSVKKQLDEISSQLDFSDISLAAV